MNHYGRFPLSRLIAALAILLLANTGSVQAQTVRLVDDFTTTQRQLIVTQIGEEDEIQYVTIGTVGSLFNSRDMYLTMHENGQGSGSTLTVAGNSLYVHANGVGSQSNSDLWYYNVPEDNDTDLSGYTGFRLYFQENSADLPLFWEFYDNERNGDFPLLSGAMTVPAGQDFSADTLFSQSSFRSPDFDLRRIGYIHFGFEPVTGASFALNRVGILAVPEPGMGTFVIGLIVVAAFLAMRRQRRRI